MVPVRGMSVKRLRVTLATRLSALELSFQDGGRPPVSRRPCVRKTPAAPESARSRFGFKAMHGGARISHDASAGAGQLSPSAPGARDTRAASARTSAGTCMPNAWCGRSWL
jgi:hypothetical protein